MKLKSMLLILGIVLLTIPNIVLAAGSVEDYYKSPIDIRSDNYIDFGNDEYDKKESYDMSIFVDEDSFSAQWVNISICIDSNLIKERSIDRFLILVNGKYVEEFYPQFYEYEEGVYKYKSYYDAKPSVPELIGTDAYFQVVAVANGASDPKTQYAVAWTDESRTYSFDPLPVHDKESYNVLVDIYSKLNNIYERLNRLENHLSKLLNKLSNQITTLFTPSQASQERFDKAVEDFKKKLPTSQMQEKTDDYTNMFNDTNLKLEQPGQELVFGESRDWLGIGTNFYLLDLRGLENIVDLLRKFLDAVIWIEFFIWLMFYLSPKLDL